MTPLAQAIANDACLPTAKRQYGTMASDIGLFDGMHFFECSAIYDAAESLAKQSMSRGVKPSERLAFLPAPRMMIELATPAVRLSKRVAIVLVQDGNTALASMLFLEKDGIALNWTGGPSLRLPFVGSDIPLGEYNLDPTKWDTGDRSAPDATALLIYALLAMINTPRIISRCQHQPHPGLQRKIAASRGMIGKFPLKAWTELKLEVTPPRDASDNGDHETHLTGGKAYHFCRCHLRIRLGQLELVSAHWRGDPALGIKQSRYAVVPPKDGVWPKWAKAA